MQESGYGINRIMLLVAGFFLMLVLGGCGSGQSAGPSETTVFTFQGKPVSVGEVDI